MIDEAFALKQDIFTDNPKDDDHTDVDIKTVFNVV